MEQIYIKDISGAILLTTLINEGCKRKFTLMKEDYIALKFSLENPVFFKLGSYVECDFGRFELCTLQKPNFNINNAGYDYELQLDAYYWKWKNKIFKYTPEKAGQEASWNLTASLDVQAGIVLRNLKALGYTYKGKDFVFSIDSTVENKPMLMSYENINILDACFEMAKKWGCECWVTENIIYFGRCEFGTAVDFEIGKNVEEMPRSESQSTYYSRIIAFGSTKNIPSNYRPSDESVVVNGVVQKRLMLPAGVPYIDAYPNMYTDEAVENIVIFDDVFPQRVGTMSDVTTKEYTDKIENEDGTTTEEKWDAYRFKDTGITFSKGYVLPEKELEIAFQSGKMDGMSFTVKFDPDGKDEQLWEIVRNNKYGRLLPDSVLCPENGDTYILSGWDSTKIAELGLVATAEQELKVKAEKFVAKSKIDPNTYTCKMMSDDAYREDGIHNLYGIGQRVNLINKAYFENGRQSRIIGFEFNLDYPFDSPVYTVGETAAYSRIGELEEKIENITLAGQTYTGGSGSGVYLIRANDSTPATDSNVYSAKRSQRMFLSKTGDDRTDHSLEVGGDLTVEGLLKALGGISVGGKGYGMDKEGIASFLSAIGGCFRTADFSTGALGTGFILKNENGESYFEVDRALFRKGATFVELLIQSLRHVGGQIILTPASMHCIKVDEQADSYRCYFRSSDGEKTVCNEFVAGDYARSQTFNIKEGGSANVSNGYYWRRVIAIGEDYIDLSKSDCDGGSTVPLAGDEIVQLGNVSDVTRQTALVLSAYGNDAPYLKFYKGIDSYSLAGKEVVCISRSEVMIIADRFRFSTGESVKDYIDAVSKDLQSAKTQFEIREGQISSKVAEVNRKAAEVDTNAFNADKSAKAAKASETNAGASAATVAAKLVTVTQKESSINQTESRINTKVSEVNTKASQAAASASNAAGSAGAAASALQAVTTKQSEINQTAKGIELKASRVEEAAGRAEKAEASINLKADGIVIQASQKAAQAAAKRTEVWIDARGLDQSKYYPVTINLSVGIPMYTITVDRVLDVNRGKPSWSTHSGGFSVLCRWRTNASGWGTIGVQRTILDYTYAHCSVLPAGSIGQLTYGSLEYIYVRGGSMYHVMAEGATDTNISLHTSAYTWSSGQYSQKLDILTVVDAPVPDLSQRPTVDEIKSQFTIDTGGISMLGKKISLAGMVTFSSLDGNAQAVINGKATPAQVAAAKSEAISAASSDATTKANSAKSAAISAAASDASNKANNALNGAKGYTDQLKSTLKGMAFQDMVTLAKLDTTIIDGGYIKTSLINADAIVTSTLIASKLAKIGGWTIERNALKIAQAAGAKILVEPSGTRFLRINDETAKLMSVRADGVTGIYIYTQDTAGKCLMTIAQTGGKAIESYGNCTFTARTGELIDFVGSTRIGGLSVKAVRTSSFYTCSNDDTWITCTNSSHINITLPASPTPGKVIYIKKDSGGGVGIRGNGKSIRCNQDYRTEIYIPGFNVARLIYDGAYWQATCSWWTDS